MVARKMAVWCLAIALLCMTAVSAAAIWPLPQSVETGSSISSIAYPFSFSSNSGSIVIKNAFERSVFCFSSSLLIGAAKPRV
jgi:hypothetical protein